MVDFNGSLKLPSLILTGASMSLLILLTLYTELAYEGNLNDGRNNVSSELNRIPETPSPSVAEIVTLANQSVDAGKVDKKTCRKVSMILAKRAMRALNTCGRELKERHPSQEEYQKYFQCSVKCVMQMVGLVDKDFAFSWKTVEVFLETQYAEKYRATARKIGENCVNKYLELIDPKDELCTSYGDFVKCLQNSVSDVRTYSYVSCRPLNFVTEVEAAGLVTKLEHSAKLTFSWARDQFEKE